MVQMLSALADHPSLVPSAHVRQLTTTLTPAVGSNALFGLNWHLYSCAHSCPPPPVPLIKNKAIIFLKSLF